jgi:hypothetical protein
MMPHQFFPDWAHVKTAVLDALVLSCACLITYVLSTRVLSHLWFISSSNALLGALWAVISTIFVIRDGYQQSVTAAVSRMAATLVSVVVCLIYLAFLPFHPWALLVLIGVSSLIVRLIGRPEDAITAAITTTVVLIVAAVSPQHAWEQPILRLVDTAVGVAVGIVAVWISERMIRPGNARPSRAVPLPGRSTDLGMLDADGTVSFTGRVKTLTNRAGEKIAPEHVEAILDAHPAVAESAVLGQTHPTLGERVVALLVAAPGQHLDPSEVLAASRAKLARHEVPQDVKVVDAIPRTATGAIDRRAALAAYGQLS